VRSGLSPLGGHYLTPVAPLPKPLLSRCVHPGGSASSHQPRQPPASTSSHLAPPNRPDVFSYLSVRAQMDPHLLPDVGNRYWRRAPRQESRTDSRQPLTSRGESSRNQPLRYTPGPTTLQYEPSMTTVVPQLDDSSFTWWLRLHSAMQNSLKLCLMQQGRSKQPKYAGMRSRRRCSNCSRRTWIRGSTAPGRGTDARRSASPRTNRPVLPL